MELTYKFLILAAVLVARPSKCFGATSQTGSSATADTVTTSQEDLPHHAGGFGGAAGGSLLSGLASNPYFRNMIPGLGGYGAGNLFILFSTGFNLILRRFLLDFCTFRFCLNLKYPNFEKSD